VTTLVIPARQVVRATPRTRLLTLDLGDQPFPFTAGQAVFAGLAQGTVRRPYSIACSPAWSRAAQALELLVQIDDHSAPDPHLEHATVDTPLRIEGPFGSFSLPHPLPERHVLFIAGGTGIAPLRSMLGELLAARPEVAPALIYSARTPDEFAFRDEFERLVAAGILEMRLTVTRDQGARWAGGRGRITTALVRDLIKSPVTRCLVCGPPALVTDAIALLKEAGVDEDRIGWEAF
jgi:ferredoxin-NADP reductase